MRIAIIGTAGRKEPITATIWDFMVNKAQEYLRSIKEDIPFEDMELVSGGAGGADHVAVYLALNARFKLELNLPCSWDENRQEFTEEGSRDWRTNPGYLANYYHRKFSKGIGEDENASLDQISRAINLSKTTTIIGKGFHNRNNGTAAVDKLLAFTFSLYDNYPRDGGTQDTWDKAIKNGAECTHVNLMRVK